MAYNFITYFCKSIPSQDEKLDSINDKKIIMEFIISVKETNLNQSFMTNSREKINEFEI